MKENSIRLWLKYNGTFDVTHHRERKDGKLHDVAAHFKNFKGAKAAVYYMKRLKEKVAYPYEQISEFGIESFGFETSNGSWSCGAQTMKQQNNRDEALKWLEGLKQPLIKRR